MRANERHHPKGESAFRWGGSRLHDTTRPLKEPLSAAGEVFEVQASCGIDAAGKIDSVLLYAVEWEFAEDRLATNFVAY